MDLKADNTSDLESGADVYFHISLMDDEKNALSDILAPSAHTRPYSLFSQNAVACSLPPSLL